jgi:hypothetical protein
MDHLTALEHLQRVLAVYLNDGSDDVSWECLKEALADTSAAIALLDWRVQQQRVGVARNLQITQEK